MLKEIINSPIGPQSKKESLILISKGFLMGCADTVPGISGGTVAYLSGIYQNLLDAIGSFDKTFLSHLKNKNFKLAILHLHLKFLVILLFGILTAIASMVRFVTYCLEYHTVLTFSFFLGLMFASTLIVLREITKWSFSIFVILLITTILTFWLVGNSPSASADNFQYWFIFICGIIGICAMLLPGISGSYLLLLLGVYHSVLECIKAITTIQNWTNGFEPIKGLWPPFFLLVFAAGCLTGIKACSKLLSYLLKNFHQIMIAFICGLMVGSLRSIWPWQTRPDFKHADPNQIVEIKYWLPPMEQSLYIAAFLCVVGFVIVIGMEWLFNKKKQET